MDALIDLPMFGLSETGPDVHSYTQELAERFNRYRPAERAAVADRVRFA